MLKYLILLISFCFYFQPAQSQYLEHEAAVREKKILKVKKLLDQGEIQDGLSEIYKLIKQEPNNWYYRELLCTVQYQLMFKIDEAKVRTQMIVDNMKYNDSLQRLALRNQFVFDSIQKNNLWVDEDSLAEALHINLDSIREAQSKVREINRDDLDDDGDDEEAVKLKVEIDSSIIQEKQIEENKFAQKKVADSLKKIEKEHFKLSKKIQRELKKLGTLSSMNSQGYFDDLIFNCRETTLFFEKSDSASKYLFKLTIDTSNANEFRNAEAAELFELALESYSFETYKETLNLLDQCLKLEPEYYDALMLKARCYAKMDKDSLAQYYYLVCYDLFPSIPEPLFELAAHFYEKGIYEESIEYAVDAMIVYPEKRFLEVMLAACQKKAKNFNTHWLKREVYPNDVNSKIDFLGAIPPSPWVFYQQAEIDVSTYCNELGQLRYNEKTTEKYLEVYSWQKMLDSTRGNEFEFARIMRHMGYLDCYVLFTLFHHDLYPQYAAFSSQNADKLKKYIYMLINWESKKYDKYRKYKEPGNLNRKYDD